jgi:hypothetical protein
LLWAPVDLRIGGALTRGYSGLGQIPLRHSNSIDKATHLHYGLVCMTHITDLLVFLNQVLNFVELNSIFHMFCMGDFNDIMHAKVRAFCY